MIIYKSTNKKNGKFYIGKTINKLKRRKSAHKYDSKKSKFYFQRAINCYGFDNFDWDVIDTANNVEELNEKEICWIAETSAMGLGYNLTSGGKNPPVMCGRDNPNWGKKRIITEEWRNVAEF